MAKIQDLAKYLSAKHKIQQKEAERFLTAVVDVLNDGLHYEKAGEGEGAWHIQGNRCEKPRKCGCEYR